MADEKIVKRELQPLFDNVVLSRVDQKKTTEGGILLPDSMDQKSYECEVLFAGPDVKQVRKGEKVVISKEDGIHIELGTMKAILIAEKTILAKLVTK